MSKQTSVEWFATQIYEKFEMKGDGSIIDSLLDQAKEMHKQEIKQVSDFWHRQPIPKPIFNEYYQETFVSEGSDFKQFSLYEHKDTITSADTIPLPQQETLYTEEQSIQFAKWLAENWFPMWVKDKFVWEHDWDNTCEEQKYQGYYNEKELFELFISLKQPKKD